MAQLVLEDIDEALVRQLEIRAEKDGVTVQAELRRLLEAALFQTVKVEEDLEYEPPIHLDRIQYLFAMPKADPDEPPGLFDRLPGKSRVLDLE